MRRSSSRTGVAITTRKPARQDARRQYKQTPPFAWGRLCLRVWRSSCQRGGGRPRARIISLEFVNLEFRAPDDCLHRHGDRRNRRHHIHALQSAHAPQSPDRPRRVNSATRLRRPDRTVTSVRAQVGANKSAGCASRPDPFGEGVRSGGMSEGASRAIVKCVPRRVSSEKVSCGERSTSPCEL